VGQEVLPQVVQEEEKVAKYRFLGYLQRLLQDMPI
jgi:hypothetical protein